MPLAYKKGICACHGEERYIVKKHPRLGHLCKTGNDARLSKEKDLTSPSVQNTGSGQVEVFRMLWEERSRISFISGEKLDRYHGTEFWFSLFAHVLPKAQNKYPKFKMYKKNIVLLTPDEHHLFDNGTKDMRQKYVEEMAEKGVKVDWQKLFDLEEDLKLEYKEKHEKRFS